MNPLSEEDRRTLETLLAEPEVDDERWDRKAFAGMLERNVALTGKQRSWLLDTHERVLGAPHYENLVSAGKVPMGKPVELMVKDKPLKPPVRRGE